MKPVLQKLKEGEDDVIPVILKITIPLEKFIADLQNIYLDVTDEDDPFDSLYFPFRFHTLTLPPMTI